MSKAVWRTGLALSGAFLILFAVFFAVLSSVSAAGEGVDAVSPTVYDLDEADVVAGGDVVYSPVSIQATNGVSEADVIVDFGNGLVVSRHITFTKSITSMTALQLAGWDLTLGSGGEIAAIGEVGCPASNPFCHCPAPYNPCMFWAYTHVTDDGDWPYTSDTPGTYIVKDGDVEGYSWGDSYNGRAPDAPLNAPIMAAHSALYWLSKQQADNGSYSSDVGTTVDAIFAVSAAGYDAATWESSQGNSLVDYLRRGVSPQNYTTQYISYGSGYAGKMAAGLAAADLDPRNFEGLDLVETLADSYDPTTGSFGTTYAGWQAWAMLGWQAAGETVPLTATQYLVGLTNDDGGWGFPGYDSNPSTPEIDSEPDTTGLVLQALLAAGEPATSTVVADALLFLKGNQADNGGFVNGMTNTQSTAWTTQGLLAAGEDPGGSAWTTVGGQTPISYLLSMQLPDGSFPWKSQTEGADLMATPQIIPALLGKPFPYLSRQVALRNAVAWTRGQQQTNGSFNSNTGLTLDAVFAIVAAGEDPRDFVQNGNTPLDYLETQAATYPTDATKLGKMIAGVVAAGGNPRSCGGVDLVAQLLTLYNASTGVYGDGTTWNQAWAMLGLAATGETVPQEAIDYLIGLRFDDSKAWGWASPSTSTEADTDSTGLALQALAAAGVDWHASSVVGSMAYLRNRTQNDDGGWGYSETYSTTAVNSVGLALQALAAYQEVPRGLGWTVTTADAPMTLNNPMDFALRTQLLTGAFPYQAGGTDDASATYQVMLGIAGRPFPLVRQHFLYLPSIMRDVQ